MIKLPRYAEPMVRSVMAILLGTCHSRLVNPTPAVLAEYLEAHRDFQGRPPWVYKAAVCQALRNLAATEAFRQCQGTRSIYECYCQCSDATGCEE